MLETETFYLKSHCWKYCRTDTKGKNRLWLLLKPFTLYRQEMTRDAQGMDLEKRNSNPLLCIESDDLASSPHCSPRLLRTGFKIWGPVTLRRHILLSRKKNYFNYLFSDQLILGLNKNQGVKPLGFILDPLISFWLYIGSFNFLNDRYPFLA